jgi:hypothetical protein
MPERGPQTGVSAGGYQDPYWDQYQAELQQIEAGGGTPEEKAAAKKGAYDKYLQNREGSFNQQYAEQNKTGGQSEGDVWRQYMSFGGARFDDYGAQKNPFDFTQQKQAEMSGLRDQNLQSSGAYGQVASTALTRAAPTLNMGDANLYRDMGAQDRGIQVSAANRLLNNAAEGEGPSRAEALLRSQSDATMAANLAMARSGRGTGFSPAALRAAAFQNAQQQNRLGNDVAALRAEEFERYKQRQLQGNVAAAQAGAAARGSDQASQQMAFEQERQRAALEQQQQQINNQLFSSAGGLGLGYNQTAQGWEQQGFGYGKAQSDLSRDILAIQQGQYNANADRQERQQAGLIGAGGAIVGSAISAASDWRAKKNVRPMYAYSSDVRNKKNVSDADVAAALDAAGGQADELRSMRAIYPELGPSAAATMARAPGYSYEYRNPNAPGAAPGRHFGPMAQDLEQTPVGRSVVTTGPDGKKAVDTGRLTLVNSAAVGEQQRRIDELQREFERIRAGLGRRVEYPEVR